MVLGMWFLLLSLAAALIIHPNLGYRDSYLHGDTPTDFITALYVAGSSLSFVGASDFAPQTGFFRLFYLFMSIIGIAMVPLLVTYLLELYTGLRERNNLGLKVHLHTAETGDAAEVVAALGPQGTFEIGYIILAEWAAEVAQVKESHHFYPILFYFRFAESFYSVSQTALVSLDTLSLIKSALDENEYSWLKESAAVDQLWRGTILELKTLARAFIPNEQIEVPPDPQTRERWQRRYATAIERLQRVGIKTTESGIEEYISLRTKWDRFITLLAPKFAFSLDEIDTALARIKE